MPFSHLGLSDKVLAAIDAAGYKTPTPIQDQAIPHVLARRDVLGIAQTGTGKTAAFVLPMLTMLEKGRARARMPRTLILEPTRELAAQVAEKFREIRQEPQAQCRPDHRRRILRRSGRQAHTRRRCADRHAGRLLDHSERGRLLLSGVELLVIDEADRMLDMGFIPDIERIGKLVPFTRQTLFFTATMPPEIQRIADTFLHNPVRVEVSKPATRPPSPSPSRRSPPAAIRREKRETLRRLLRSADNFKNAIIFCNRKREVAQLHRSLLRHKFNAVALHGDLDQSARTAALDAFRNGEAKLLIASDVAARGLDIPEVSHVFNFDVPHHPDDYVHRIGRTGRAGMSGTAITIVSPLDVKAVAAIEKLIGQTHSALDAGSPAGDGEEPAHRAPAHHGRRSSTRAKAGVPSAAAASAPAGGTIGRRIGTRSSRPKPRKRRLRRRHRSRANPGTSRDTSRGASPGRPPAAEPRKQPVHDHAEDLDGSHLPAFLLRPFSLKA